MENNVEESVAVGGNVWKPPVARPPVQWVAPPPPLSMWRRAWEAFLDFAEEYLWIVIALSIFMVGAGFAAGVLGAFSGGSAGSAVQESQQAAYQQEYGYTEVDIDTRTGQATVLDVNGETKEVNYSTYKGFSILHESQDELQEKIEEVESGTYPEQLRNLHQWAGHR